LIACHGKSFAECNAADTVVVHATASFSETAAGVRNLHPVNEVLQPTFDSPMVVAGLLSVAGAKKAQYGRMALT
jgi:hypothetical protein